MDEHGVLIAGHLRVAAATRMGLKSIPVIVARGWSEDEKQAYRLADNELAARGSWDPDLLFSELRDLKFSGFDLDLIGFEPHRLEEILAGLGSSGLTDPDGTVNLSGRVSRMQATGSGDWVHRKPMPQISAEIRHFWVLEALCSAAVTRSRRRWKRLLV